MKQIKYKSGYKYQLHTDYRQMISICPVHNLYSDYITLNPSGLLTIKRGYAWDGCSGPTLDTRTNMRAGLLHDALSQLIREGKLSRGEYRQANVIFRHALKEDGMFWLRRKLYFRGVSNFFARKIATGKPRPIRTAP